MANEIVDKLFIIIEEAKKEEFPNAIRFADKLAKKKLEEFSYTRSNQVHYCGWQTVREYIYYARDIKILDDSLKISPEAGYPSFEGFKSWIGDTVLEYCEDKGISMANLRSSVSNLIDEKKLPTTEYLYQKINPDVSEKHFKWTLSLLQSVKPLTINVCRKWVWIPSNTFEF